MHKHYVGMFGSYPQRGVEITERRGEKHLVAIGDHPLHHAFHVRALRNPLGAGGLNLASEGLLKLQPRDLMRLVVPPVGNRTNRNETDLQRRRGWRFASPVG